MYILVLLVESLDGLDTCAGGEANGCNDSTLGKVFLCFFSDLLTGSCSSVSSADRAWVWSDINEFQYRDISIQ